MKTFDFLLVLISTFLLAVAQLAIKVWIEKEETILWPIASHTVKSIISFEVIIAFMSLLISGVIWIGLLNRIQFSVLYPMISISYVFGLLGAILLFNEYIPPIRWFGVAFIAAGLYLISKP